MKMYHVKKDKFLDWYFKDRHDFQELGANVVDDLREVGKSTITVKRLFEKSGRMPPEITEEAQEGNIINVKCLYAIGAKVFLI